MSGEICFGAGFGQTAVTAGSPTRAINGLTVARLMSFYALATNTVTVYVGDLNVNTSTGFALEAGKYPVVVDTNNSKDTWYCIASTKGATLTYITNSMA